MKVAPWRVSGVERNAAPCGGLARRSAVDKRLRVREPGIATRQLCERRGGQGVEGRGAGRGSKVADAGELALGGRAGAPGVALDPNGAAVEVIIGKGGLEISAIH